MLIYHKYVLHLPSNIKNKDYTRISCVISKNTLQAEISQSDIILSFKLEKVDQT